MQFKDYSSSSKTAVKKISDEKYDIRKQSSAFAKVSGGIILVGVSNDGIVNGQSIDSDENSLEKVEQQVESLIGKMKWCCTPQRSNHWNVKLFQVQKIENRYVITIYVAGMRGAVFAKSPKSHELEQDAIDLLIFEEWKQCMTCGKHMLHLHMERESRKKAPLGYTCTLTVAKEGA